MKTQDLRLLALAFSGGFFVVGLPYWLMTYGQVNLPDAIWGPGLVVVAALAALVRIIGSPGLLITTLVVGASVPAAVMARVVFDVARDPTSHNLWPFEIVLALGPGFLPSLIGSAIGGLWARRGGA